MSSATIRCISAYGSARQLKPDAHLTSLLLEDIGD